jgi:hypothetical protein
MKSRILYSTIATAAASRAPAPPAILTAAPVNCAGVEAVGVIGAPPVGLTVEVELCEPVAVG